MRKMKTDEYNIRYYLKSLENPMFRDITAWHLFDFCLLRAFPKGHFTIGRRQIEEITGIKGTTAYKAIKRLEKAEMVTITVTYGKLGFTEISIVNWPKYQPQLFTGNNSSDQRVTKEWPKSDQRVTHYDKEIGNKKEEILTVTQKELNLTVDQLTEFQRKYSKLSVRIEYEKAQDYILSTGKTYKDYTAFFRNWLRRADEDRHDKVIKKEFAPVEPYHNEALVRRYREQANKIIKEI